MNIALIDDETAILESVRKCVENEITDQDYAKLFTYTQARDFLGEMEQGCEFDILISDIDTSDMSGLELGRKMKEEGCRTYLIFFTAYFEYAAESYRLEAYQYILKEDMEKRLPSILRQLIDRVKKEKMQFRMIGTPTSKIRVYYRDIIYIEKEKGAKYISYRTVHGIYKERIALKKLNEELISDEFILIERIYIINVSHIASMKDGIVQMDNGANIFVNRISFKRIKEQISLYRGNL